MSYDLFVFDADAAPRSRDEFIVWYSEQMESADVVDRLSAATANLLKWYQDIGSEFPDMNGPSFSDNDIDNPKVAGYSFCSASIYVDFRWSVAETAYEAVRRLAQKHCVGFYDVSGDEGNGEIMFPGDPMRPPSDGAWRAVAADFRSLDSHYDK